MASELWRLEHARIAEERRVDELLTKAIAGREITRLLFAVAASQDMVPPRNGQMPRPPELTRQMPTKYIVISNRSLFAKAEVTPGLAARAEVRGHSVH
jgi:hypothetical protein